MNVMEMSHRGGATTQFAAVPLNLCKPGDPVDYLVAGSWGDKAAKEAKKYAKVNVIWSGKSDNYIKIPNFDELEENPDAKYLHICANETIYGVEFKNYPTPKNKDGILVADMSSNFCSKPVDVTKFGLIYAGAQKNVGPSGVTIVIVRKDLIGGAQEITPSMLDYKTHVENKSLYNTPPCFGIYMCGLVFEDLLEKGGLVEVEKRNKKKVELLYDAIDMSNGFFRCPVEKSVRSLMNVPFTLEKSELEAEFIKEAAKEKMVALLGRETNKGRRRGRERGGKCGGDCSFGGDDQYVDSAMNRLITAIRVLGDASINDLDGVEVEEIYNKIRCLFHNFVSSCHGGNVIKRDSFHGRDDSSGDHGEAGDLFCADNFCFVVVLSVLSQICVAWLFMSCFVSVMLGFKGNVAEISVKNLLQTYSL
ncbi:Phosphoserine aminotransferase [Ancistrocladus abbreviatus]